MPDYAKQTLDEARRTLELYREAELKSIPGTDNTTFVIFARENGHTLVASAVARVVAARRIVETWERKHLMSMKSEGRER